jgi:hypothetical protein
MKTRVAIFLFLPIITIVGIFGMTSFTALKANAQTASQMVITWRAYGSYVPPAYTGKAIPNQESQLTATLTLVANGKSTNLSGQTIYWYLNDTLIGGGVGKNYIVFSPFGTAPAYLTLRAEIPNYNGTTLMHDIQIPLFSPKAVIEASHPSEQLANNPVTLQATPYFFYTSDPSSLSYVWSVNGQTPSAAENPETLQISIDPSTPSGSSFGTSLTITNPNDHVSADDSTNIVYVKSL